MSTTYKLQLDIRFKKDIPEDVLDFLLNGHIYDDQFDFKYFHGEDAYEEHNIFYVKHQFQFTRNEIDEYQYELFTRIFVKDDDFASLIKFCTYVSQFTDNDGFVGYYINIDNPNSNPELLFFNENKVTIKDYTSGKEFTTDWKTYNDPNS